MHGWFLWGNCIFPVSQNFCLKGKYMQGLHSYIGLSEIIYYNYLLFQIT